MKSEICFTGDAETVAYHRDDDSHYVPAPPEKWEYNYNYFSASDKKICLKNLNRCRYHLVD